MDKLKRKVAAGADFGLTQPIFSEDRLDILQESLEEAGIDIPIYIGVMPVTSYKNAEFLHNEVPGILVPDEVRESLARWTSVADQRKASVEMTQEFISKIARRVHGFYMITPRGHIELVTPLIGVAKKLVFRIPPGVY
jgi:homocysteine S-methyltransferase